MPQKKSPTISPSQSVDETLKIIAQPKSATIIPTSQHKRNKSEQQPSSLKERSIEQDSSNFLSVEDFKQGNIDRFAIEASKQTCYHYERKCTLKCEVCNIFYPCRLCHDWQNRKNIQAMNTDQSTDESQKKDQWLPHQFNTKNVKKVKCNKCAFIQKPSQACVKCKTKFGEYYCAFCCLYDDDTTKEQFHCMQCGVCKTGGRAKFFHCSFETCKTCVSIRVKDLHEHVSIKSCPYCDREMDNRT